MSYNLTLTWTPPSPAPANGYRVKYWNVNSPETVITVTPNVTSSPAVINIATSGCYAGTIESACGASEYSNPVTFNACIAGDCLTGDTVATATCGQSDLAVFTLGIGHTVTVQMTGYYYTGSGTRTITGNLLDNSNAVVQAFTYTQNGSTPGTTVPSSYTLSTEGIYKLQVNTVNCSNGSGTATMTVDNCTVIPPPTYYYYNASRYECLNNCNESEGTYIVRSLTTRTTNQFFKVGDFSYQILSVASGTPAYDADVSGLTAEFTCNESCGLTGGGTCDCYTVLGSSVTVTYNTCDLDITTSGTFNEGAVIPVYPGSTITITGGSGSLSLPNSCTI